MLFSNIYWYALLTVFYSEICLTNSHKHVLASEKSAFNGRRAKSFFTE